ncbi:MAG: NAD(P)-dependent oxidoreductase [Burkholderiaceae bacterium]
MASLKASLPAIGMVGLGIMGGAMAQALIKQGYSVCGYDVTPATCKRLRTAGGQVMQSAAEVAQHCEVLIVSLSTSAALNATVDSIAASGKRAKGKALIVVETSTLPLLDKENAHASLQRLGIPVLDCPISGTAVRLKERAWTVYSSGDKKAFDRIAQIFRTFTDNLPYVGAFGNGTKMKFAANHLVAIYNVACAESVTLARKMGLNPQDMLDLFGSSAVIGTGVMRLRMPQMIARQYTPPTMKVEVWQKDMQVIGDMAKSVDCPLPLFSACAPIYSAAMAQGLDQQDTASVNEVLAGMAGIAPATRRANTIRRA